MFLTARILRVSRFEDSLLITDKCLKVGLMRQHGNRHTYKLEDEETVTDLPFMAADSPLFAPAGAPVAEEVKREAQFRFGRMFPELRARKNCEESSREMLGLLELGLAMNSPSPKSPASDSNIPAGYTYLAQFVSHEITFDDPKSVPVAPIGDLAQVPQGRSPSIDLDSLYGRGPTEDPTLYETDRVRLRSGNTVESDNWRKTLPRDLYRDKKAGRSRHAAVIGDPRNDENLTVAQTHLAFIKFHNRVVDGLAPAGGSPEALFLKAQEIVVKHFQWIVLRDLLPRIIDANILQSVLDHAKQFQRPEFFDVTKPSDLFMPVEFSVGAFRLGHSMIRDAYEWNFFHNSKRITGAVTLPEFFRLTHFSGDLEGNKNLKSEWIVDWRRFYDFTGISDDPHNPIYNRAKKIDTSFHFHLDKIAGFPHVEKREILRSIPVRNLLRGLALKLPTGQAIARAISATALTPDQVAAGPHQSILSDYGFHEKTPLWYYILKEAELGGGNRLGPVGSRIVAETFVGLILHSEFSILKDDWRPHLGNRSHEEKFDMMDMLAYADVIFPTNEV